MILVYVYCLIFVYNIFIHFQKYIIIYNKELGKQLWLIMFVDYNLCISKEPKKREKLKKWKISEEKPILCRLI